MANEKKAKSSDRSWVYDTSGQTGRVLVTQPDGRALRDHGPNKPRNYIGLAVVVLVCFNPLLGIISVVFSVKSHKDFLQGKVSSARTKGQISFVASVIGIMITAGIVLGVIFWPVIFSKPET